MNNAEWIVSLIGTAGSLLIAVVTFAIKCIRAIRDKTKTEGLASLTAEIVPLIETAEKFLHYSGEEKKEYVLTKLNRFAMDNGIAFDAEKISEQIDRLVELTRQVNSKNFQKGETI